jgi:hypothetical protein
MWINFNLQLEMRTKRERIAEKTNFDILFEDFVVQLQRINNWIQFCKQDTNALPTQSLLTDIHTHAHLNTHTHTQLHTISTVCFADLDQGGKMIIFETFLTTLIASVSFRGG